MKGKIWRLNAAIAASVDFKEKPPIKSTPRAGDSPPDVPAPRSICAAASKRLRAIPARPRRRVPASSPAAGSASRIAPHRTRPDPTKAMATLAELTASLTTLRIAYDPALVPPGGAEVVSACVSPVSGEGRMTAEPAGRKFHEKAMRAAGLLSADDIAAAAAKAEAKAAAKLRAERTPSTPLSNRGSVASFGAIENDDPESQENDASYKGPKELIRVGNREWPDLYDVIGLGRERYLATEKQIRDEYKRRSLWLHPDKCGVANASEEDKEKIEARFKNLQLALETLTDTKRRREYDSVDAPPTKLPSDLSPETFFDVAVPAFKSLAMFFDGKQDANKFIEADPDAPFERVRKMYEFWAKFKSWREFPANDEEDLEQAEDRYARREMERENKAKREKEKKLDTKKIKTFVERAEAADPRVIKKKLEEKEAREAKKHVKGAGRREAEEAAKKEAEAAAAAAAKGAFHTLVPIQPRRRGER